MSQGWSRSDRKEADRLMRRRKLEEKTRRQQIRQALQKAGGDRSLAEKALITAWPCLVNSEEVRSARRDAVRKKMEERVEPMEEIRAKVEMLVEAVRMAKYLVVYTGAGVSTAASIPDYRGPNGVWTLLKKGQAVSAGELSDANPTITHMALAKMHAEGLVQHIVSQNCDGLHLRSGLSRTALSELHGNMYIEVCTDCGHEIVRLFDVTEKTGLRRHITGRMCPTCSSQLRDTIVHFGEKGALEQPLNWAGALRAARRADTILCLGSSLKVLKKYPSLWGMERVRGKRAKLYIVNLQWTPKDGAAVLKVSARCDDIMIMLMKQLGLEIPPYNRGQDQIFHLATPLRPDELHSHSRRLLKQPSHDVSGQREEDRRSQSKNSTRTLRSETKAKSEKLEVESRRNEREGGVYSSLITQRTLDPGWFDVPLWGRQV
uniref:NAD-dependent protein deacetylase sirtuin-7 n=1 Tax=Eptatretus burgeri TaxID=7764 RepID=A0A8C4N0A4_EPTBU